MKRFSAQYIITNSGPVLKRAIITAADDGTIVNVEETGGELRETGNLEYHNGIIIPAFVNCHCHLELSHLKGTIGKGGGLGGFISQIRTTRDSLSENIVRSGISADNEMYRNGIQFCADICNTSETFEVKKESRIGYHNMIEVFGIDPAKAGKRIEEVQKVAAKASKLRMPYSLVPHSVYSMSLPLLRLLKEKSLENSVTSIHFMETREEKDLVELHTGKLMESYRQAGLVPISLETAKSHADAILNEVTASGNLILVHNTFADSETIRAVKSRVNLFWCLCPNSNFYIENAFPPVKLLLEEKCEIVIGTDSLASNTKLDIMRELITLQLNIPGLSLEDLIAWATINGARAVNQQEKLGRIAPGFKPGLLLIENADIQNMKLTNDSTVKRLL